MMKRTFAILSLLSLSLMLLAQESRSISLADGIEQKDVLTIYKDQKESNVVVSFVYDESNEKIIMKLTSIKKILHFRENILYKQVVRNRYFHPEKLNYFMDEGDGFKFYVSKKFRKSMNVKRQNYLFRNWVKTEGLQMLRHDYVVLTDSIVQEFNVLNQKTNVTVSLKSLYLMQKNERRKMRYDIVAGRDINITYNISIVRNPCFGESGDTIVARKFADGIRNSYVLFVEKFGRTGTTPSESAFDTYLQMKKMLLNQYEFHFGDEKCSNVKRLWSVYNSYVDSIAMYNLTYVPVAQGIDAKMLTDKSYQIDASVSRWLVSDDVIEKRDLKHFCEESIKSAYTAIQGCVAQDEEQKKALELFKKAEEYFRKTTNRK